jgi:hypothetical protein
MLIRISRNTADFIRKEVLLSQNSKIALEIVLAIDGSDIKTKMY